MALKDNFKIRNLLNSFGAEGTGFEAIADMLCFLSPTHIPQRLSRTEFYRSSSVTSRFWTST